MVIKQISTLLLFLLLTSFAFSQNYYEVLINNLNIRSGAGKNFKSIGLLNKGELVNGDSVQHNWIYISSQSGIKGFVSIKYLAKKDTTIKSEKTYKGDIKPGSSKPLITPLGIIILLVILVLIVLGITLSRNRKKQTAVQTPMIIKNNPSLSNRTESANNLVSSIPTKSQNSSSEGLKYAYKYFGNEWQSWLALKATSIDLPKNFYETIALALESLSNEEQKDLLLSFLNVKSNSDFTGSKGIYISVGLNNYAELYSSTFDLLQKGGFSKNSIFRIFKRLIFEKRHKREEYKKQEEDNSIIDVTGGSQKLDTSKYQDSNYQSNNQQQGQSSLPGYYDLYENRLGRQYKDRLSLTDQEISWLNKFWNPNNTFLGIEGCCIETIKLYLVVLKELNEQLEKKETNIAKEVDFFQTEILKLYQDNTTSYESDFNNSYLKERAESEVFVTIFKRAENAIRETFGHKRKISEEFPYSNQPLIQEFENRIGLVVNQIIQTHKALIAPPDEKTEEELNVQNVNRWKIRFEQLEKSFTEAGKQEFINGIYVMEKINQKNPSIENIFFEASKFIAKFDKTESLKFYIYYLYYDLKSHKIDNKQLAKTIQKNLFKTNEQLNDFGKVVADLLKTNDLKRALEEVVKIYLPKRKKINLDVAAIEEVREQDQGTVELLNEYLQDQFEDENTTVKTEEINDQEIKLEIASKTDEKKSTTFTNKVSLNEIQTNVIALFAQKSFNVPFTEIDDFCKSKGVFKNQLIDSINESCYESLDDVLIEETEDRYILNENYYKKIFTQ